MYEHYIKLIPLVELSL